MKVYNVTPIIEQIDGFAGVCSPEKDANDNFILSQNALEDKLLEPIWELIQTCALIDYVPKARPQGV